MVHDVATADGIETFFKTINTRNQKKWLFDGLNISFSVHIIYMQSKFHAYANQDFVNSHSMLCKRKATGIFTSYDLVFTCNLGCCYL